MRIVTIGCPVPDRDVDNHSIANAPSLFDYDACVIDMQALSDQVQSIAAGAGEFKSSDGRQTHNAASTSAAYGLAELLEQRRYELRRLAERGGIIVAFAYPNLPHPEVVGMPGFERYTILPAPAGATAPFRWPLLRPAEGKEIVPAADRHPAAGYVDALASRLRYRALWDTAAAGFPEGVSVLAKSVGGAAVAIELALGAGRLVLLPPADGLTPTTRQVFTAAVLDLVRRLHEGEGGADPPLWVARYDTGEIAAAREAARTASDGLAEAARASAEADALLGDASRHQTILWRGDPAGFEAAIVDGFRTLGYNIASQAGAPVELRDRDEVTLLETASSEGAISERAYLNLQRRIEEHFLKHGVRPHGAIVASGHRLTDPRLRRNQFAAPLLNACETYGYALIPADALYELITYALEDPDYDGLAEIRASIRETRGLIEIDPAEEGDADPVEEVGASAAANGAAAETETAVPG